MDFQLIHRDEETLDYHSGPPISSRAGTGDYSSTRPFIQTRGSQDAPRLEAERHGYCRLNTPGVSRVAAGRASAGSAIAALEVEGVAHF